MNRTRWKLLIGGLGLALGGLAAVAEGPQSCSPPTAKSKPDMTTPATSKEVAKVAPPTLPAPSPMIPAPSFGTPVMVPKTPGVPVPAPSPAMIAFGSSGPVPNANGDIPVPPPSPPNSAPPVPAPCSPPFIPPPAASGLPIPGPSQLPATAPIPANALPVCELPARTPPVPSKPPEPMTLPSPKYLDHKPEYVPPDPKFPLQRELDSMQTPAAAKPAPPAVEPPQPKATPAAATPKVDAAVVPASGVAEKKLKVMLHMGDERPRFEVKDGDEVYLRVVCDKVDVKSPAESGSNMSTMKAAGKVTFVTPGGEGTCQELTVIPGTGQVVVTGKVEFTSNWGKAETTVSAEKLTFHLGTTPGVHTTAAK